MVTYLSLRRVRRELALIASVAIIALPFLAVAPASAAVSTCSYYMGAHDFNKSAEYDFKLTADDTVRWANFTPPAGMTYDEGSPHYESEPFTFNPSNPRFIFYIFLTSSTTQTNAHWDVQVSSSRTGANPVTCTSSDTFNVYDMQMVAQGSGASPLLTWDAIPGAISYSLMRDGVELQNTADTSFTDSGLDIDTTYDYTVVAHLGFNTVTDAEIQVNPLQDTLYTPTEL